VTAGETDALRTEALRLQALRLNDRYLREVVIAWNLCPWAERALATGEVRQRVLLQMGDRPAPEAVLPILDELAAQRQVAIGLLIFPRLTLAAPAFDAFAERVRRADHARRPDAATTPPSPEFLLAAFHPLAGSETFATPPQLVSFLRRTPDPTLQLVRTSVLRRATGEGPGVSDDVTRRNYQAVTGRGVADLDAVLRDIRRDRDESYARLGMTT
jgi:hypothetical protein